MKSFLSETLFTIVLLVLLLLLTNPSEFIMPDTFEMLCTGLLLVFFVIFGVTIVREKALDEREELHQFIGARFAYLFGAGILVVGIVTQVLMHHLTFWLPLALGGMLSAKLIGKWYAHKKY